MMKSVAFSLVLACTAEVSQAAFCNFFSTGPVAPGTFIRKARSTLVVPQVPKPQVGLLSLWTGMGTSNGDLVQALVESYNGTADYQCGLLNGTSWCAYASTLKHGDKGQLGAKEKVVQPGDHITMLYEYVDAHNRYHQHVLLNGKRISFLKTVSGHALGWGTAEECQPEEPCGIVPAHDWINTELVFDKPDPNYNTTVAKGNSTGDLITSDHGKTWTAKKIHISECNFNFTPT